MRLDNVYYESNMVTFREKVKEVFADDMVEISYNTAFKARGYFKMIYKYLPLHYDIIIENEIRTFTIQIEDDQGAKNSLYRIEKFDNVLSEQNILKSLNLLRRVLTQNNFNLYITVDDKIYRKNSDGMKRVKDIKEILNG